MLSVVGNLRLMIENIQKVSPIVRCRELQQAYQRSVWRSHMHQLS